MNAFLKIVENIKCILNGVENKCILELGTSREFENSTPRKLESSQTANRRESRGLFRSHEFGEAERVNSGELTEFAGAQGLFQVTSEISLYFPGMGRFWRHSLPDSRRYIRDFT